VRGVFLWSLAALAAQTQDSEIRNQVTQACMDLLNSVEQGNRGPQDAIEAAWTLASLRRTECAGLLQRIRDKADRIVYADFAEAVQLLEKGKLDYSIPANLWEKPIEKWLEPRWQIAKEWYQEPKRDENNGFEEGIERCRVLAEKFAQSEEANRLPVELLEEADFVAYHILDYAWSYMGAAPEQLSENILQDVLLKLFPRKITAEQNLFEKVGPVTETFIRWLQKEDVLSGTSVSADRIRSWSSQIVANGMDPGYWGMAKSFMMQARANGIDTRDEEALRRYMLSYNLRLLEQQDLPDEPEPVDAKPNIPIVEYKPKVGRNEPCPCGSGKKYKKCCG